MRSTKKDADTPLYVPDFLAKSVEDIDFDRLKKAGVRFIAFDADSTLVPYRGKLLAPELSQKLAAQLDQFDGACIASNRVTNDLHDIGASLGVDVIRATWTLRKPARGFFERVIKHFNAKPSEIAMVGDKLVADIYGANRMGLVSVWVEQLGPDNPLDKVFGTRRIESRMMRKYLK